MTHIVPAFRTSGELVDLAALAPQDIDFAEMALALSKIARFNGINRGCLYSVAQHSVMGADALFRETGNCELAGYFLLHDGHEYLIGDVTRPTIRLIDHLIVAIGLAAGKRSMRNNVASTALNVAKAAIDAAIVLAAQRRPLDRMPLYARQVKEMDERMCAAEASALFGANGDVPLMDCSLPPPKLTGAIVPWGSVKAELAFLDRLERYLGIVVRAG